VPQGRTTIILARHGESVVNVVGLASDDLDGNPLTYLGQMQAHQLARSLRGRQVSAVIASPVQRARETGEIVAAELGLPIWIAWGIEEIRVGVHAGELAPETIRRGLVDFRKWLAEEDLSHGYAGGESAQQVADRCAVALDAIADRHAGQSVLVVSHGGAIAFTVPMICADVTLSSLHDRQLANCSTVVIERDGAGWTCLSWQGVAPESFVPRRGHSCLP
jgi:2,3-bisphosphoglycerate-dependent phosphoglycerate mutase